MNRTGSTLSILYNNAKLGIIFGVFLIALVPITAWSVTETLEFDGEDYLIEYTTVNMDVYDIYIDASSKSLILDFDMLEESIGMLDITIGRALLDSVLDGEDLAYGVEIDAISTEEVIESSNEQLRTLSITVPSGSFSVEIIGNVLASNNPEPKDVEPVESVVDEPIEPITPIETEPVESVVDEPIEPITPIETEPVESVVDEPIADGCGPGTILQDGVCIIDESVVDEPPKQTTTNMNIIISVAFAFMIAGGIATVLALIAKASKRS